MYVADHATGIELVMKKGRLGESYNIGDINEWANIDIVKLKCLLMDEQFTTQFQLVTKFPLAAAAILGNSVSLITYVADRVGHDCRYTIDQNKSTRELGYQPSDYIEACIRKMVEWYFNKQEWWLALVN